MCVWGGGGGGGGEEGGLVKCIRNFANVMLL